MISTVDGDILYADADVIVQQCNCITKTALGLSESIKRILGVDPYGHRRLMKGKRNCAIKEDQGKPGTTVLYDRGASAKQPRYVACMMAQFSPGKPGKPVSTPSNDSYMQRLGWFKACLENLTELIEVISSDPAIKIKVAFPYLIGCGLAGGKWEDYIEIIEKWALANKDKVSVSLIRKT